MRTGILAVVMLLLGFGVAFADQHAEERVVVASDTDGVQRVQMTGGSYYFKPRVVVVKVNVPVELQVSKEEGIAPHNIVLKAPEAGIDFAESLGSEAKIIRFTPTKVGSYPFECTKKFLFFETHKERGMHGVLEVVPQ
jgi:plastocyanin domain-containing protein